MRTISFLSLILLFLVLGCRGGGGGGGFGNATATYTGPNPLYVQCHLKVLKPGYITWVNYTASQDFVPAGTPVTLVSYTATRATFTRQDNGTSYTLDFGNGSSDAHSLQLIHKFIDEAPPLVDAGEFQSEIDQKIAKIGMTKEQVYYSMGPPAWAGAKTNTLDKSQIMNAPLWRYERRTFGKDVGIQFDANGIVTKTEGIWN